MQTPVHHLPLANNCWYGIADVQTIQLSWLPTVELYTGGSTHVEVNKSYTLWQDDNEPRILRVRVWLHKHCTRYNSESHSNKPLLYLARQMSL